MTPIQNLIIELRKFHKGHVDIVEQDQREMAEKSCETCAALRSLIDAHMGVVESLREAAELGGARVFPTEGDVNAWNEAIARSEKDVEYVH